VSGAEEYRRESRRRWATVADGWLANAERLRRDTMPVSAWMVDAIAPQPGHTVLELAAGTGEAGFLAAELIAPGGTLITSDFSPEMLTAAQRRAAELGLENVRFKQIDAESIDLDAASVDGVLCRWGLMLMADPGAALRECRRVLRPGGRLALAAWAGPEDNPWTTLPGKELVRRGLVEPAPAEGPGQFAWADPALIAERLADAGFVEDVVVEPLELTQEFDGVEDWWGVTRAMSGRVREVIAGLSEEDEAAIVSSLREAAAPYAGPDGRLAMPGKTWVARATA